MGYRVTRSLGGWDGVWRQWWCGDGDDDDERRRRRGGREEEKQGRGEGEGGAGGDWQSAGTKEKVDDTRTKKYQ